MRWVKHPKERSIPRSCTPGGEQPNLTASINQRLRSTWHTGLGHHKHPELPSSSPQAHPVLHSLCSQHQKPLRYKFISQGFQSYYKQLLPFYYLGRHFYIFPFVFSQISSSLMQQVPTVTVSYSRQLLSFFVVGLLFGFFSWGRGGI